jgi:hypothetical protein
MRTQFAIAWLAVVLSPAWSLAQEVPGIDLTKPQQEAPEQPPSGAEEQPPIDLSQPGERPAASREGEKDKDKKEARPLLPFTDEDVALGDRVKAVQRKGFLKRGRLELTPMFSATVNDAFYQKFGEASGSPTTSRTASRLRCAARTSSACARTTSARASSRSRVSS